MFFRANKTFLLLVVLFIFAPSAFAEDASKVFDKVSRSVVVVWNAEETADKEPELKTQGSGVIIAKGEVVTNCHVIENANYIGVQTKNGEVEIATLFRADWEKDICLLKVPGLKGRKAKVRRSNSLKVGETVYAIGSPEGMEHSLSAGLVSQLHRKKKNAPPVIQTDASMSSGSSGGGLFDKKGKLVGIMSFVLEEAKNIGFAIPVEWIDETRKNGIKTDSTSPVEKVFATYLQRLTLAHSFIENEDWKGLEKHSLLWVDQLPSDSWGLFYLGLAYHYQGKYSEALESYHEALRINPEDAEVWYNLGLAYFNQGKHSEALESYREALRINPELVEAWYNLGLAYFNQGKHSEALESYREALRINPELVEAWNNLGLAYSNQGKYSEALESYREALRINPELVEAWGGLGNAYHYQGKYSEALESYREALRINPEYAEVWYNLGLAYFNQGKHSEALESYHEALRINPELAEAWGRLALTYKIKHQDGQAREAYWQLKKLNPYLADKIKQFVFR